MVIAADRVLPLVIPGLALIVIFHVGGRRAESLCCWWVCGSVLRSGLTLKIRLSPDYKYSSFMVSSSAAVEACLWHILRVLCILPSALVQLMRPCTVVTAAYIVSPQQMTGSSSGFFRIREDNT